MKRRLHAVVSAFAPWEFGGGAERVAWSEARRIAERDAVVFVHTGATPPPDAIPTARIGGWLRRLHDPRTGARSPIGKAAFHALLPFNPVVFMEALGTFRRLRPAVVHTHNLVGLSPSVWLAARLAGARVIHTHHDLSLMCQRATMTRRDGRPCEQRTATCLVCRATRVVKRAQTPVLERERFPSAWLRDRLGRQGEIARPFVEPSEPPQSPPDEFRALFLGRLVPAKGIETLLEAAPLAGVPLTIAGDGPMEGLVRAAPGVTYAGYVDGEAKARLLAGASVLVIPSIGPEAAPLVFFEALAAGVPAIVSTIGGLTELAELGTAILVPPGDADALARVLRELADDPAQLGRLRERAHALRDRP